MSLVVQFDVDGVLADFTSAFREDARRIDPSVSLAHPTWDFSDIPMTVQTRVWTDIRKSSTWWYDLGALTTDLREGDRLVDLCCRDGVDVYFVTAREGNDAKHQTEDWLYDTYGMDVPTVLLAKDKGTAAVILGVDYAIEDKLENAVAISMVPGTASYLLDRPYNAAKYEYSKVTRVPTLTAFLDAVYAAL